LEALADGITRTPTAPITACIFRMADRNAFGLLRSDSIDQNAVHKKIRSMAVI